MKTTIVSVASVFLFALSTPAAPPVSLFDGKSLEGWFQIPTNSWTDEYKDVTIEVDPAEDELLSVK